MPTQDQINDVLAKVETYRVKKAVSDAAQAGTTTALMAVNAARDAWDSAVEQGALDSVLTPKLLELIDAQHDAAPILADAQAKAVESSVAISELNAAIAAASA